MDHFFDEMNQLHITDNDLSELDEVMGLLSQNVTFTTGDNPQPVGCAACYNSCAGSCGGTCSGSCQSAN